MTSTPESVDDGGNSAFVQGEKELMFKIAQRDEQSFQQLMDGHAFVIRQLVNRLLSFDLESEDVVQQVFLIVWRKAETFRCECSIRTWLTRIAIRQARNHQRALSRWWKRAERLWMNFPHNGSSSITGTYEVDPRWDAIQSAMKNLSYIDREILILVYLQEQSIAGLSQTMNEQVNTLEVRLHRAKQRLRMLIADQGIQP